jgi:hypothetical protein
MGGARKLWLVLAAAVCAAALAACGGGGDSTTAGTEGGAESATQAPGGPSSGGGQESSGSSGGGGGESSGGGGSSGFESKPGPGPSKGERSYAFRSPGGDNSIQEFGEEGEAADRAEATTTVNALFAAIESGDWGQVCAKYLSATNVEQIKVLAEKAPQVKGKGCADVLGGLNQVAGGRSPDTPKGGVASMRIEGDTAFAIYRGVDGNGYAVPLKLEGGQWKLTALAPTPLQFGG